MDFRILFRLDQLYLYTKPGGDFFGNIHIKANQFFF